MSKVPDVKDFFNQYGGYTREEMLERAKDFAKTHTEAALKAASKAKISFKSKTLQRQEILSAYPLNNIK